MKRLVCIVEGHGEQEAVPNLCWRIFGYLGTNDWIVDPEPVRHPRSRLVNQRQPSPSRRANEEGLRKAIELARRRRADAVLVLCDQDDDCPAVWGPDARRILEAILPGGGVMAVREYETWLLWNRVDASEANISPERTRDAKKALSRLIPGYLPTTHQLDETRRIDIERLRTCSASFDKLVRVLATICGKQAPAAKEHD